MNRFLQLFDFAAKLAFIFGALATSLNLADAITKKEYNAKYEVGHGRGDGDSAAIAKCLRNWGKHPFGKEPTFRRIKAGVKVFGIGAKEVADSENTTWPQLILISPGVNVLGKSTYRLMNPQGWYCVKANVTVLSKSAIEIGCTTHLTSSNDGTEVLGSDRENKGGVVVLGKVEVSKPGCAR